jgi:basic membrane protein A
MALKPRRRAAAVAVAAVLTALCALPVRAAGPLKVAVLLPGSPADRGYNADGARAADALKKDLKADVKVAGNVSVANQSDVYRQFAAGGSDLVIGWGGQFTDGAMQVGQEFPKVKFLIVNSGASNGKNVASLDLDVEQWEFIGGWVTAKLSKKGAIGWVGGQCFPATAANMHAVEEGAKYANPKIRVVSTFTGDFEDPIKAQQATQAMIEGGVDALTGNLNNGYFGIFKAAKSNGNVPVVTEWIDNHELAPEVIVSSIVKAQARFVVEVAKGAENGSFKGVHHQFKLPADWAPVMAKTDKLPKDIYDGSLKLQEEIVKGKVKPAHNEACPK